MRGRTNGCDHPTWEDGTPILVGQRVRWHEAGYLCGLNRGWHAVVHEVSADEVRIGGMDSHDEEWEDQASPDDLELEAAQAVRTEDEL